MSINEWPQEQRPRERLINKGAQALTDPELLAIFLRTGVKGKNAIELGRDLMHQFGSLGQIFSSNLKSFSSINGLGPAKFAQLQAAFELSRRALAEDMREGIRLNSPSSVRHFLQLELGHLQSETFVALFLDTQHRLICREQLFTGTLRHASVYPREVVKAALARNAAAVIIAHNHPSGTCAPSDADFHVTSILKAALHLIDVNMLDHMIVCHNSIYSFAEHGQL